jgi:hypothetical protein
MNALQAATPGCGNLELKLSLEKWNEFLERWWPNGNRDAQKVQHHGVTPR